MAAWNVEKLDPRRGSMGARLGQTDYVEADELKIEAASLVFITDGAVVRAMAPGTWGDLIKVS